MDRLNLYQMSDGILFYNGVQCPVVVGGTSLYEELLIFVNEAHYNVHLVG